jgi:hypothetical protein
MNLEPWQKIDFESKLTYLGGALSGDASRVATEYLDLEKFFVEATLFMNYDVRVTQTFLNWIIRYGVILCPSKIRRLLIKGTYDSSVLGAFISILIENDQRPRRWDLLNKKPRKGAGDQDRLLFQHLPVPRELNPHFMKFGLRAPVMSPNPEKYLMPKSVVLGRCAEVRNRSLMMGVVAADILSFLGKHKERLTPYQIAKSIHQHRAQVYSILHSMEKLGTLGLLNP